MLSDDIRISSSYVAEDGQSAYASRTAFIGYANTNTQDDHRAIVALPVGKAADASRRMPPAAARHRSVHTLLCYNIVRDAFGTFDVLLNCPNHRAGTTDAGLRDNIVGSTTNDARIRTTGIDSH
jgi:hypothetical protein